MCGNYVKKVDRQVYKCDGCNKNVNEVTLVTIKGKETRLCGECSRMIRERKNVAPTETETQKNAVEIETENAIEDILNRIMAMGDEQIKKFGIEIKGITVRKTVDRKRYIRGL